MTDSIPNEVVAYLGTHRVFDADFSRSECGVVGLSTVDSLSVRDFWVDGEGRGWLDDPHSDDDGYYAVPGVDLVNQVEGFDPSAILVWIPGLKSFGTWDCDHWDLIVFEHTQWETITADPVRYLDAQWNSDGSFDYCKPWTAGFEWRSGRPF